MLASYIAFAYFDEGGAVAAVHALNALAVASAGQQRLSLAGSLPAAPGRVQGGQHADRMAIPCSCMLRVRSCRGASSGALCSIQGDCLSMLPSSMR